jgi:hypothetical protein
VRQPYRRRSSDHLSLVTGLFDELAIGNVVDDFASAPRWIALQPPDIKAPCLLSLPHA